MPAGGLCPNAKAPFWFSLPLWLWCVRTHQRDWLVVPAFHCVLPRCPFSTGPCRGIYGALWHFLAALVRESPVSSFVAVWYHLWTVHILGILFPWHRTMTYLHWLSVLHLTTWWILSSIFWDGHPGFPWWYTKDHQYKFVWTQGYPLAQTSWLGRCQENMQCPLVTGGKSTFPMVR